MTQPTGSGFHVASLAHAGRIWEAYLEFDDDRDRADVFRARFRFEPADGPAGQSPAHTGLLIVEQSYEDAVKKARSFETRQLVGLLRSSLPDEEEAAPDGEEPDTDET